MTRELTRVRQCILALSHHGNINNNELQQPSECNWSRNSNSKLWQSAENMNDLSVFPHVYALAHNFVLKLRSCCNEWLSSSCSVQALPMRHSFLSWVQNCTSTDICLLKRIIQLIISLSYLRNLSRFGGRYQYSISILGFTAPKDTILNNTADAAWSVWDQRNGAGEKAFYIQYGPHQVSQFLHISQMHFCHACTTYWLFSGLQLL